MKRTAFWLACASIALASGCSTWDRMSNAEKGTVGGAVVGGAVGNAVGGGVLGTVGGAAVGGVVGHEVGRDRDERR
ncbi:MAG: glycine zipper 2TM domain-containing protein [Burkholderiales bacterium]|nr:glycine zipper 2TM domain-containing protein [Burkholderiales bacterium]